MFFRGCDYCDEWYHGTCIGLKERDAKKIKKYYCKKCQAEFPSLEIQYKPQYAEKMQRKHKKQLKSLQQDSEPEQVQTKKQKTDTPKNKPHSNTPKLAKPSPLRKQPSPVPASAIIQCYGPGCTEAARPNSKYCSDDCGMNLARNRIFELLPWRVSQWSATPSVADKWNRKELEQVCEEREKLHRQLKKLDEKKSRLEDLIKRAKSQRALCASDRTERDLVCVEGVDASNTEDSAAESGTSGKTSDEAQIDCISCGNPQPAKVAFRHMERCFNRAESQTTCWSVMRTQIEGDSMLCDFYSPQQRMYCKRLKHICPEHYKEEKNEGEVCGAPLVFPNGPIIYERCFYDGEEECHDEEKYTDFCRLLKMRCNRHVSWDRLRRAHIDLERFKLWCRLEELMERECQLKNSLANRPNVVSLLLNETIDCCPTVPLVSPVKPESKAIDICKEHDHEEQKIPEEMETS